MVEHELVTAVADSLSEAGWTPETSLGIAVSGGSDSIGLMHLMRHLSPVVLHVDHHLREDSSVDASFVRRAADSLELDFVLLDGPTDNASKDSTQLRARKMRYELFESSDIQFIATAHTLDDQAETVLMRILRGASIHGASGIADFRPMQTRNATFVRPLIDVRRSEIRKWLTERNIEWVEDPSNESLAHDRNWIRHVVLPLLQERREGVHKTLARFAELTESDDRALEDLARQRFNACDYTGDEVTLKLGAFAEPQALATRVVRMALEWVGARVDRATIDRVVGLVHRSNGGKIDIGNGAVAQPCPDGVVVRACTPRRK